MSEFDKIIGYEDEKAELIRFCDVLKNPEKYAKLGVKMPSGILLHGRPGVGKTMMAKCFIAESGCKVLTLRKEKPNGDFVNEIRATYEKADSEGYKIVFLDDMDKFANEDEEHPNPEEFVTVQSCIDEYKERGIFSFATVNAIGCIPESLFRAGRFDKVIEMEPPRGKDVVKIVSHYLNTIKVMGDVDAEDIARIIDGHSCAELESVVNEAGIYAAFDDRDRVSQKDVVRACMRLLFNSSECQDNDLSEDYIRKIAYHEAGHAVVSEILIPESVNLISVSRYTGSTEGITKYRRFEEHFLSVKHKEYGVMRSLGGKAATEIVYGESDIGCNSDMHNIYSEVRELVDNECVYGFTTFESRKSSQYLIEGKDRLVASEIERFYKLTKKLLIENRSFMEAIVEALMERQTLTFNEIQAIKKSSH